MKLVLRSGKSAEVPQNILERLRDRYEGDVLREIEDACDYTFDHPRVRPRRNIGGYLNNWLAKELPRRDSRLPLRHPLFPEEESEWRLGHRAYTDHWRELYRVHGVHPDDARAIARKVTGYQPG